MPNGHGGWPKETDEAVVARILKQRRQCENENNILVNENSILKKEIGELKITIKLMLKHK